VKPTPEDIAEFMKYSWWPHEARINAGHAGHDREIVVAIDTPDDMIREAAGQAAWRASADRKAEQTFLSWSMRRDLAEAYHPSAGPADPQTFGRRAA
jgi:hypothetical protein